MLKQFIEKKEKAIQKDYSDVATWMRNYGVDDDTEYNGEQMQDMLEGFHNDSTKDFISSLTDFATLLRSEIEGRRKEPCRDCMEEEEAGFEPFEHPEITYYNSALTDILALLEK